MTLIGIVAALIICTLAYLMVQAQLKAIKLLEETLCLLQKAHNHTVSLDHSVDSMKYAAESGFFGAKYPYSWNEKPDPTLELAKNGCQPMPVSESAMDDVFPKKPIHEDAENFAAKRQKYLKKKGWI